jgi:hypothetical protein
MKELQEEDKKAEQVEKDAIVARSKRCRETEEEEEEEELRRRRRRRRESKTFGTRNKMEFMDKTKL